MWLAKMKITRIGLDRKDWQIYADFLQVSSQAGQIILLKLREKGK